MDFIFMLTREDATIEDCLEVMDAIEPLQLQHVGFKDVGVNNETLLQLNRRIQASGAKSYMEVVSTTREACLASARTAAQLGVDCLLGGTDVENILPILEDTDIDYFPFPGRPEGHPTRLGGSLDTMVADSERYLSQGCAGVDLLAYRAIDEDPLELVRSVRRSMGDHGRLIIAGSIESADTIKELERAGADAFTIGSAIFKGDFSPRKGLLCSQLRDVLAASSA